MTIEQILNWVAAILLIVLAVCFLPILLKLIRNAKASEKQNTHIESQITTGDQLQQRQAEILAAQEDLQERQLRLLEKCEDLARRTQTLLDRLDSPRRGEEEQ